MCNGRTDVSGHEPVGRLLLLSVLCRLPYGYSAGKLAEACLLQFPVCIFYPAVFIQPLVRTLFRALFRRDIEARKQPAMVKEPEAA